MISTAIHLSEAHNPAHEPLGSDSLLLRRGISVRMPELHLLHSHMPTAAQPIISPHNIAATVQPHAVS